MNIDVCIGMAVVIFFAVCIFLVVNRPGRRITLK